MRLAAGHNSNRPNLKEHFGTGIAIVLLAAVVTYATRNTEMMNRLEMLNLDAWVSFQLPPETSDIAVVEITNEDYASLFSATSPLSPNTLSSIIRAVAVCRPRVIGVDLDTASWTKSQRDSVRDQMPVAAQDGRSRRIPLVWAVGGYGTPEDIQLDQPAVSSNGGDCFAVPATREDRDGIVRAYFPEIVTAGRRWPSFAEAILRLSANNGSCDSAASGPRREPVKINFRGGRKAFHHITASAVLGAAFTEPWKMDNPLRDKIVLVGGAYRAARDTYLTPQGLMSGVDIVAKQITSATPGGGIREVPEGVFLTIDVLIGLGLLIVTYYFSSAWAFPLIFVFIPALAFLSSLLTYNSTAYFASFVPVLIAIFLHEAFEHAVAHQRLKHEVRELRARDRSEKPHDVPQDRTDEMAAGQ